MTAAEFAGGTPVVSSLGKLAGGTYVVAVDGLSGASASAQGARIDNAIASLNTAVGTFGVNLVKATEYSEPFAEIHIHIADTSPIGGMAQGVLGVTIGQDITLIRGWNYYVGANGNAVNASEYDFQSVVTHELGHSIGIGHSADSESVMYPYLAKGQAKRSLTTNDLRVIEANLDTIAEPLLATPATNHPPTPTPSSTNNPNTQAADVLFTQLGSKQAPKSAPVINAKSQKLAATTKSNSKVPQPTVTLTGIKNKGKK